MPQLHCAPGIRACAGSRQPAAGAGLTDIGKDDGSCGSLFVVILGRARARSVPYGQTLELHCTYPRLRGVLRCWLQSAAIATERESPRDAATEVTDHPVDIILGAYGRQLPPVLPQRWSRTPPNRYRE
jgi:hypothetical protein